MASRKRSALPYAQESQTKLAQKDGPSPGSPGEVFLIFLRLGCTSFGGPIAHLGYYERELVHKRRWCDASTFGEIVALAQTLPGPASSQVGFTMGILRAGLPGGLAAWIGFTLPSAILMLTAAMAQSTLNTNWLETASVRGLMHGLQLVAIAVVAQAVLSMQKTLAPDASRIALAFLALALALFLPGQWITLLTILVGAAAGLLIFRSQPEVGINAVHVSVSRRASALAASLFVLLLGLGLGTLLAADSAPNLLRVTAAFLRSGALVFGGGHVVLPLLEKAVVSPGWVAQPVFLSGYGIAQALPGPLFTFAAYLGASVHGTKAPLLYGVTALVSMFAPGLLAVLAVLPYWSTLRRNRGVRAALKGMNAVVVGLLAAALISPLWTSTVRGVGDVLAAAIAFALLVVARVPAWLVVLLAAACMMAAGALWG